MPRALLLAATMIPIAAVSAQPPAPPPPPPMEMPSGPASADWPTWGYDQYRTGWNRGEATLSKANVGKLRVAWQAKLPVPVTDVVLSTMTAPVIAGGIETPQGQKNILFVLGSDDVLYAVDADNGATLWTKAVPNPTKAVKPTNWLCPNSTNATPTIDKARGLIFFIPSDGKLRALNLADGAERMAPTEIVAPYARAWSLNLIGNVLYTTSGRACGQLMDPNAPAYKARDLTAPFNPAQAPIDPSAVSAMDVGDLANPQLTRFYTSGGRPAAPWGRGGLARGPNDSVIFATSDGLYDPPSGNWGDTLMRLSAKAARVVDSFTPPNYRYILQHDLAGSGSPVVFPFGGKTLVAYAQKESVLRLLDANDLGGGPVASHQKPLWQSPRLGNDIAAGTDPSSGVWGAVTTYLTPGGKRFLYLPIWGPQGTESPVFPVTQGPTPNGYVMAFEVVQENGAIVAQPRWKSGDMIMADPPVVANGVVYATSTGGQRWQNFRSAGAPRMSTGTAESARFRATPIGNLTLYAFDAETGKQLYSSAKLIGDWVHFGEPVVALGKVFIVTHDAQIYAFGLGKPRK